MPNLRAQRHRVFRLRRPAFRPKAPRLPVPRPPLPRLPPRALVAYLGWRSSRGRPPLRGIPALPGSAPIQPGFAAAIQPQPDVAGSPGPGRRQLIEDLGDVQTFEPPPLIGDLSPLTVFQPLRAVHQATVPPPFPPHPLPPPPSPKQATSLAPSTHAFKISDNQSPMPQDRVYFTFNYFSNLNSVLDRRFQSSVDELRAYRYIFGFEKTFDEGRGSVGVQLPLDNITAESAISGNFAKQGGSSTSLNNLSVFAKYILKINPETGSLISAGLAVTPATGPNTFAGAGII